ncbi:MAG: hypothetical protein QNJ97_17495 [Myxococcota bacterium]|nr:hypothetical protein [Myxococcota bacterium]
MLSKRIYKKVKFSQQVAASIEEHIPLIASGTTQMLGEQVGTGFQLILEALGGQLRQASAAMVTAAHNHAFELRDNPKLRARRDNFARKGAALLVRIRQMAKALQGDAYTEELGFKGPTPKDPTRVLSILETVLINLRVTGTDQLFDMSKWIPELEEISNGLRIALPLVAKAEREAETSRRKLRKAIEAFDRIHDLASEITGALLAAIGEPELAGKVRPSRRKTNKTARAATKEPKVSKDQIPIAAVEQAAITTAA